MSAEETNAPEDTGEIFENAPDNKDELAGKDIIEEQQQDIIEEKQQDIIEEKQQDIIEEKQQDIIEEQQQTEKIGSSHEVEIETYDEVDNEVDALEASVNEENIEELEGQENEEEVEAWELEKKSSVSLKDSKTFSDEISVAEQPYIIPHVDLSVIDETLVEPEIEETSIQEEPFEIGQIVFPELVDPGIDNALRNTEGKKPVYSDTGKECYLVVCKALGVIPSLKFVKALDGTKVNFRYYGLNPYSVRAVAESLMQNKTVTDVDLEDNWLTRDAAYHLGEMLKVNVMIKKLNLCGCRIGPEGAQRLCDGLAATTSLKELDLSWNELADEGMEELTLGLSSNNTIQKLNLSHNKLGNGAGITLGLIMSENTALRSLNLSWNQLYPKEGLIAFFKGLVDSSILELDMSWNGLGNDTGKPLRQFLQKNRTLQILDISNNRLSGSPINMIRNGLQKNKYIEILKIGYNPLTQEDAMALLTLLLQPTGIKILDLDNIWVEKEFFELQTLIMETREGISVVIGGVYSNYELKGPDVKQLQLARATYEGLSPKRKKQKRHFGHFLLKMDEKPISKKKFRQSVEEAKLKISENLITQIMKNFQGAKKKVDPLAMKQYYLMLYPDTKLPEKKKKKRRGRKKKSEQSDAESGTTGTSTGVSSENE